MMKINLIEYFEESVQRCPQKTAVIDRDRTITFSELRGKALVLASAIGCIKRPAAVFLNKSIESVYADLAIMYSLYELGCEVPCGTSQEHLGFGLPRCHHHQ